MKAFETTQRAYDGGHPLVNETAARLDLGHGTPLLILGKRDLVAFLKRTLVALPPWHPLRVEVEEMIAKWDTFAKPVDSTEGTPGCKETT